MEASWRWCESMETNTPVTKTLEESPGRYEGCDAAEKDSDHQEIAFAESEASCTDDLK